MSNYKISKKSIMSLFEAAKWAPSSGNEQPWRFVYAMRDSKYWGSFFRLLRKGNRKWCKNASVLVITISKKTWDDDSSNRTHSFDTGAAWENLALQGRISGLVVHGMEGFDNSKARKILKLSREYSVEMMIAIGKPGRVEDLSDYQRKHEFPKGRKKLGEIVFEGRLGSKFK